MSEYLSEDSSICDDEKHFGEPLMNHKNFKKGQLEHIAKKKADKLGPVDAEGNRIPVELAKQGERLIFQ